MRKRTVAITLAAMGVVSVFSLVGCSADDESAGSLQLALEGDGQKLVLTNGAPLDRAYAATYPVSDVQKMVVNVRNDGHLAAKCTKDGKTTICEDTPFFAKVTRIGSKCMLRTRVYDVNGRLLIDTKAVRDWQAKAIGTGSLLGAGGIGTSDGVPSEEDIPRAQIPGGATADGVNNNAGGHVGVNIGSGAGQTSDGTAINGGAGGSASGNNGSASGSGSNGGSGGTAGGNNGSASGSGASGGAGGGATGSGACFQLGKTCCPSLTGAMSTGCFDTVTKGDLDFCDQMKNAYQSIGYCGGSTSDGTAGSGGGSGGATGGNNGSASGSGAGGGSGGTGGANGSASGSGAGGGAGGGLTGGPGGANPGGNTDDGDNPDCGGGLGGGGSGGSIPGGAGGGAGSAGGANGSASGSGSGGGAGGSGTGGSNNGSTGGSASGGGTGGGATGGGATGGGSNGGTTGGGSNGGTTGGGTTGGGGTGMCPPTTIDQARAKFCAEINDWLGKHNIKNITLDCSKLDGNFNLASVVPPKGAYNNRCLDIIHDAWFSAYGSLGSCGTNGKDVVYNWKETSRYDLKTKGACNRSPIVLDLDGNGIDLSDVEDGVSFNLFNTGSVKTAWPSAKDGLLAIDWNHDGKIDSGSELFGEDSFGRGTAFADGFKALGELDYNHDGVIDARDPSFAELVVWVDRNRDGVSQGGELIPLRDLGIKALELSAIRIEGPSSADKYGNNIPLVSHFVKSDGSRGLMADAYFRFR